LGLKIEDIIWPPNGGPPTFVVSGKTGSRSLTSLRYHRYIREWIELHPKRSIPSSILIYSKKTGGKLNEKSLRERYKSVLRPYFTRLLDEAIGQQDRNQIQQHDHETPPVSTPATGTAHFQLSSDGKQLNYDLSTTNLKGFMMAHIHQGKAGASGQPLVELSMGKGKITSSDLQGPLAGKQMSDLVNMIKSGGAYVNVHTQQNQNGEILGQIMSG
jgi:hypothetical protein